MAELVTRVNSGFQEDLAEIAGINIPRKNTLLNSAPLKVARKAPASLLDLDLEELAGLIKEIGQPAFRAKQIWTWLYQQFAQNYSEMSNLPRSLVEQLAGKKVTP